MGQPSSRSTEEAAERSAWWTGVILGIGLVGSIDEIVFHQLFQWHQFYVDTSEYWRTVSDGLFHAFTTAMFVWGALRLWLGRRSNARARTGRHFWAGGFLGGGAFQLFDGVVNHKILELHPVRESVDNVWMYDAAWIGSALALLLAGWWLTTRSSPDRPAGVAR